MATLDQPTIDAILDLLDRHLNDEERQFDDARGYKDGVKKAVTDSGRSHFSKEETALYFKAATEMREHGDAAANLRTAWYVLTSLLSELRETE